MSSLLQYGAKPGLERISRLTELLGRPQHDFAAIHVAGTNGKGSTSLMISRILSECGYKTGLFVSPHLHSYRERFQIDGELISVEDLSTCLQQVDALLPQLAKEGFSHPTEFEVLTAAAFLYFSQSQIDIAVVEVGMGGQFDSTNIITPLVSIITNIELDHMSYLGNTIGEIAYNKAGIIKPGVPIITGESKPEALKVLSSIARQQEAELLWAPELLAIDLIEPSLRSQRVSIRDNKQSVEILLGLPGAYQRKNLALVWLALHCLRDRGFNIPEKTAIAALSICSWPGRLEVISDNPIIILDAGHNEAGASALNAAVQEMLPEQSVVAVVGILDDKDARPFLANLPASRAMVITRPDSPRAQNWRQRAELARLFCAEVYEIESIEQAVGKGLELLKPEDLLLITGSFYVLDRARQMLKSNFEW